VEVGSAIHLKMLAAQVAVPSQQVVESQELVLEIIECSLTDQAKVGDELFSLPRVYAVAILAAAYLPGNRTGLRSHDNALPEAAIAGSKNSPKDAIARGRRSS
jgi:hypothetical protein